MTDFRTLAYAVKITLINGEVLGLTNIDFEFTVGTDTYNPINAIQPIASAKSLGLDIDNAEITVLVDGNIVTERDIRAGLYYQAEIQIALVDYLSPPTSLDTGIQIIRGHAGEVKTDNGTLNLEIVAFTEALNKAVSNTTSATCPYVFGGAQCGLDLLALNLEYQNQAITAVGDNTISVNGAGLTNLNPTNFDGKGILILQNGRNQNLQLDIVSITTAGLITYRGDTAEDIEVGDEVTIRAGCNKTYDECTTYDNRNRFGGFLVGGRWLRGLAGIVFTQQDP